jgi:cytochrome c6
MKKILVGALAILSMCALVSVSAPAAEKSEKYGSKKISGEAEFKEHCAVCHPDGGNVITAEKTLQKKDLDANGIKKSVDIIKKMRNPGPGMTKFDKKMVSDKEARAIADYILKTFKQ